MKKTLIMKILAGAISAALSLTGSVNSTDLSDANVNIAAENGTHVAEANNVEGLETNYNWPTAAEADGTLVVAEELIARDQAGTVGETVETAEAVENEAVASVANNTANANVTTVVSDDKSQVAGQTSNQTTNVVSDDKSQKTNQTAEQTTNQKTEQTTEQKTEQMTEQKTEQTTEQKTDGNTTVVVADQTNEVAALAENNDETVTTEDENEVVFGTVESVVTVYVPPVTEEIVEPTESAEPAGPIGQRVCNCGYTMDIYTYGLSDAEFNTWKEHIKAHIANGEPTNYKDI